MCLLTRWQSGTSYPRVSAPLRLACAENHYEDGAQTLLAGRRAIGAVPRGGGGEAMPGGILHDRGSALWGAEASERCWALR